MFLVDRPNIIYIYEEIASTAAGELQLRITLALEKYAWSGRKTLFLLMFFDVRELRVEGVRWGGVARVSPKGVSEKEY